MSTKADTLDFLKDKLYKSDILPMFIAYGRDMSDENALFARISDTFAGETIVVRSSCSNEDGENASNAGHYESVLNVDSSSKEAVMDALKRVLASYEADLGDVSDEQVLIQQQLKGLDYSGVIFTRDINHNRPYYVITYAGMDTEIVTSGAGGRTVYIAANTSPEKQLGWRPLIAAVNEIQEIYNYMPLDIEFGLSGDKVVTFQVRPFVAGKRTGGSRGNDFEIFAGIDEAVLKYHRLCDALGERHTIFSDMAFWNPAEMIGTGPHPLDYSLYREIITHSSWNTGLYTIGYRMVDGDLMYQLGNKPYISLKQSFLSLIPADIDDRLAVKLLKYYEDELRRDVTAHDKIEFEIVFSSYDFMTGDRLLKLKAHGFSDDEIYDIKSSLFKLTNDVISAFPEIRKKDIRALNGLSIHRENIKSNMKMVEPDVHTLLGYFTELLESIKHYGTPKFARQARLAFMAKALCLSLAEKGYFTYEETDAFMRSLNTVAAEYERDYKAMQQGKISRDEFDERYGHLRAGTYDITCDTYRDQSFVVKPEDVMNAASNHEPQTYGMTPHEDREALCRLDEDRLYQVLEREGFTVSVRDFQAFLLDAMEEREYFKFEFTKSLSLAIDILRETGALLGISREDMAYLTVDDIVGTSVYTEQQIGSIWRDIIEESKARYAIYNEMILPDVICDDRQIQVIEMFEARPNFITSEIISGELVLLDGKTTDDMEEVSGKIVAVAKADPGYDWIFAAGIKGFITKYGGVASHMAIRCGEFGIPAAIGCGEVIYSRITGWERVTIDCLNQKVRKE